MQKIYVSLFIFILTFNHLLKAQNNPVIGKMSMNQLGFIPDADKIAVVPDTIIGVFQVKTADTKTAVFTGVLSSPSKWSYSNQNVSIADFSSITTPGVYYLSFKNSSIPGDFNDSLISKNFEIKENINDSLVKGVIKAYYFCRSGIPILPAYGGKWARAEGHPDTIVYIHSSAASTQRPAGTVISSPRGWYDAGDYNKYIVNSGISTYTLLALYEHYPEYCKSLNLNIPESNNNVPDLLNEILWNLRWMLTMQDPNDGGVYHKCTTKQFSDFIMPDKDTARRYVVQKGTAATLDFAAVTAVASRIFKDFSNELPGLADSCQNASIAAWKWAKANPNKPYNQPSDIGTGTYNDTKFTDEVAWASSELYLLTGDTTYLTKSQILTLSVGVPSWSTVNTLGLISLAHNLYKVNNTALDTIKIKNALTTLADKLYNNYTVSAYKVSITGFTWGSNSEVANEAMVLLQAFHLTQDKKYLEAANADLDYLVGKNPTGYCFVTGFGTKSPMDIHHRPSFSDGILDPVPGLMSGGPNPNNQSQDCGASLYPSTLPALSYLDKQCSYSTNEIAINWNAPLAYLSGSLAAIQSGNTASGINKVISKNNFKIYPNPAKEMIYIEIPLNQSNQLLVEIFDMNGRAVIAQSIASNVQLTNINIGNLNDGLYFVKILGNNICQTQKIIKSK